MTSDCFTHRYAHLLATGQYIPVYESGPAWIGATLSVLCVYDAVLLGGLTFALYTDRTVGFFQSPAHGETPAAFVTGVGVVASFMATLGFSLMYLALFLCDFAREAASPLGWLLGLLLLLHSVFFGRVAAVAHYQTQWWVVSVTDWMREQPSAATGAYVAASAASGIFGIIVLSIVNGDLHGGGWPLRWTWSGPAGTAFFLGIVWLYDAAMLSLAAQAAFFGEPVWHFRSRPEYKAQLLVASSVHSHAGWFMIFLSGLPIARTLPPGLANLVVLWCLANAAAHASIAQVALKNRESSFFVPTEFSERARDASLLGHGLMVLFFGVSALVAWFAANNPVVCDGNDGDHHLTLNELAHCRLLPGWIDGLESGSGWPIFVGGCLAALWLLDGALSAVGARVIHFGEPLGFLAPPAYIQRDPERRGKLLRRLQTMAAGFLIAGTIVLILALIPEAFNAAFGPRAILASNLLAFSLLGHVPPLLALSNVFRTGRPVHMLHPTETSKRSPIPSRLALFGAFFCFFTALWIFITQDALPGWPEGFWPSLDAANWHGLLLAALLSADAIWLLNAADLQMSGEMAASRWGARPLPGATEEELYDLGERLAIAAAVVQHGVLFTLVITFNTTLSNALFGSIRALPMLLELTLALHGVLLGFLGYLFKRGLAIALFAPSPRADDAPRRMLTVGGGCLVMALLLPLLDGWFWWETSGILLFGVLSAATPLTHGLYSGGVLAQAFGHDRRVLRRVSFGVCALCASLMGACFMMSLASGGHITMEYHAFWPVQYMLVVALALFSFINVVPIFGAMEAWYTGVNFCGFSSEDAPHATARIPSACALLMAAIVSMTLGGSLWTLSGSVIDLNDTPLLSGPMPTRASLLEAESCRLYFGTSGCKEEMCGGEIGGEIGKWNKNAPELIEGFDASATSTQLELLAFCELLHGARSPLHPDHAPEAIQCFMKELHDDRVAQGQSFPIEPRLFDETVRELLF